MKVHSDTPPGAERNNLIGNSKQAVNVIVISGQSKVYSESWRKTFTYVAMTDNS